MGSRDAGTYNAGMSKLKDKLAAVVFDMDGTLIESSSVIPDAYIATVRELGGPTYTRQQVVDIYSVGPPAAMLTELLGRAPTPREVDRYHDRLAQGAHAVTVYRGIIEALEALQARVPLAVFTGASVRACRVLLQGAGLLSYFTALVGADEVARSKPQPDGIELACERLGIRASRAGYVGDAPNDLEAARRSGAAALAASWGHLYRPGEPADVVLEQPADLIPLVVEK
jgi:HAD superfamily hydrolase (TIGR01549 family)